MSELNAGTIKGRVELDRSGAISSMAATVTAIQGGAATLRGLLATPFRAGFDATGLRQTLGSTIAQATGFAKTITEAARSGTELARALGQAEGAVRSLNAQSGEFTRTLRQVSASSGEAVGGLRVLPGSTNAIKTALAGLRSETGGVATGLQRIATRGEELGVSTTSLSNRLGTLGRNLVAIPPATVAVATALGGLDASTAVFAAGVGIAAVAAKGVAGASDATAAAAVRASSSLQQASARGRDLGVAVTSLSARLGTLVRNLEAVSPAATSAAVALTQATAAASAYATANTAAATSAGVTAAAANVAAAAQGRVTVATATAAAATTALATTSGLAIVAQVGLARYTHAAATSALALSAASRQATRDIVLMRTAAAGGDSGQLLGGLHQAMQRLLPTMESGIPRIQTVWQMVRRVGGEAGTATPAIGTLGNTMLALPGPATSAATAAGGLATAIGAVAAAALVVVPPLVGFGVTMAALNSTPVKLASELRQTAVAFEVMTGSAANAQKLMGELKQFADTTPLSFPEVASAAKQLLAMGVETDKVTGSLRMLGDMSALLNQPLGEMAYLYGQIKSQGRAMTQDLNQFAGRGVPIYAALAKTLHTTTLGVRELAEAGKIGFAEIDAALISLTGAGGRFSGGLARQGDELAGLRSTAEDAYASIQSAVGEVLIKNLDLAGTIRQTTELFNAAKPIVVQLFQVGTSAAGPFISSLQSVIGFGVQVSKTLADIHAGVDKAFGEGTSTAIGKLVGVLNPFNASLVAISSTVKLLAYSIETIREGAKALAYIIEHASEAARYLTGDSTQTAITKEEVVIAASAKRKRDAAKAREALSQGTAATPAVSDDLPPTSRSDAAADSGLARHEAGTPSKRGSSGDAKSDAEQSAERVREALTEATATRLLAAGREYEAAVLKLQANLARDVGQAKNQAERVAARSKYEAERAQLDAKATEERNKTLRDSAERTAAASLRSQVAALKAAGEDLKARLAEIAAEFRPKLAAAAGPQERQAIEAEQAAEIAEAKSDAEEKARKKKQDADGKAARETEQRETKAAETRGRTEAYRLAAQAAALEAQGRRGEAELLRFDSDWTKRLAAVKDDGERAAAYAQYQAERVLKLKDAAVGPRGLSVASVSSLAILPATVADAQGRVAKAKAGSGERELARLDLRDSLGKALTPEEQARRIRLGERFGRSDTGAASLPPIPSPVAGVAARLTPATLGGVAGAGAARTATSPTINPVVGLDVPAVTKALVEAVRPVIRREIEDLTRGLRDRNHAANVGGRI